MTAPGPLNSTAGSLFVVATPIGNLDDISARALKVLRDVKLIAAEDTRHSQRLMQHFGISTPLAACHEHNEREEGSRFIVRLLAGDDVALISDAGTPLISDPGYHLVRQARAAGINVVPVPGACALIAALSAAGLPSDRFIFEGFLPAKAVGRRARLEAVKEEPRTLIFYEAPHRILECLQDMELVFGGERLALLARELGRRRVLWAVIVLMLAGIALTLLEPSAFAFRCVLGGQQCRAAPFATQPQAWAILHSSRRIGAQMPIVA